jgi:hypothetical protein
MIKNYRDSKLVYTCTRVNDNDDTHRHGMGLDTSIRRAGWRGTDDRPSESDVYSI